MAWNDEPPPGVPEWTITFGDMMALLLTFFVMLVSMSEVKQTSKVTSVMAALQRQFGDEASLPGSPPDSSEFRGDQSILDILASLSRAAQREDAPLEGESPEANAADGASQSGRKSRFAPSTRLVGVITFAEDGTVIASPQLKDLAAMGDVLRGKPNKIELRGHCGPPNDGRATLRDDWDCSFARCREVLRVLVDDLSIEPERIRLAAAGRNEPLTSRDDAAAASHRVEILLLDEVVPGLQDTIPETQAPAAAQAANRDSRRQ